MQAMLITSFHDNALARVIPLIFLTLIFGIKSLKINTITPLNPPFVRRGELVILF